ncbi:MAG: DNA photolyase [bacterium]|nr:DNA photolyase [candidate division KSB1 bacterium]MDH7560636.1 DNA photolyase [bacterium]
MGHRLFFPQKVFIECSVAEEPLTKRLLDRLPEAQHILLPEERSPLLELTQEEAAHSLLLARQRGHFAKPCPGTKGYICCGYWNLNVAMGCNIGCHYCILRGYLSSPVPTIYTNTADMWQELDQLLRRRWPAVVRIGTGELADSLAFDHLSELNRGLVCYFADKRRALFELKTKTDTIEPLLGIEHGRRTVLSWSLNTARMVEAHEPNSAPLARRLEAARKAQDAGYRLGFHFDPLIWHEGWKEEYAAVVHRLFSFARPENIAWISLGALRYPAHLDELIRERHGQSDLPLGELLPGKDGKLRYFRAIREEMFRWLYQRIRLHAPHVAVYLCMESDEVWRRSFGWSPGDSAGLARLLDERVHLP